MANVVEHVVTTTVLYDTAGRVTATTTTTTDRTTATASHTTAATIATHTAKDTAATIERDTAAVHHASHTEAAKEPAATARTGGLRLRLRWLLLGIVAALCLLAYHRFKQFANHDYWKS